MNLPQPLMRVKPEINNMSEANQIQTLAEGETPMLSSIDQLHFNNSYKEFLELSVKYVDLHSVVPPVDISIKEFKQDLESLKSLISHMREYIKYQKI